jgi:hypothetical protein
LSLRPFAATIAVTLAAAFSGVEDSRSADDWEPGGERDGIESSHRPGPAGSPPIHRAVTTIEASLLEILAVLNDDSRRTEWMARCVEARLISREGRWTSVHYSKMSAPWPLAQRDAFVEARVSVAPGHDTATVTMSSLTGFEPVDRVVRIPHLEARFRLQALDSARTRIAYEVAVDLAGNLPGGLTHGVREEIPFDTVRNLRGFVPAQREHYTARVDDLRARLDGEQPTPSASSPSGQPARLAP